MKFRLQDPGSVHGPCEDGCQHPKCALEKAAAKQPCKVCNQPVGTNRDYVYIDDMPVHCACLGEDEALPDEPEEPKQTTSLHGG